jgi:hypothetical protein
LTERVYFVFATVRLRWEKEDFLQAPIQRVKFFIEAVACILKIVLSCKILVTFVHLLERENHLFAAWTSRRGVQVYLYLINNKILRQTLTFKTKTNTLFLTF